MDGRGIATDHVRFICSIGELTAAITGSASLETFLHNTVAMVAQHLGADVSSIYLYDAHREELVLRATVGLNEHLVGSVQLGYGEGLVGLALKELRPIREAHGSAHPSYRFIEGLHEERYDSFLAVPLLRGIRRLGVLVVQRDSRRPFTETDVTALKAVGNQLAASVEHARVLIEDDSTPSTAAAKHRPHRRLLRGSVAAGGFASAPAMVWERHHEFDAYPEDSRHTVVDLERAITMTAGQLESLQQVVVERLSDEASLVFAAHLLMLRDDLFTGEMLRQAASGMPTARAVKEVVSSYTRRLSRSSSSIVREKADDLRDLATRVLANLEPDSALDSTARGHVVIARRLLPSDLLVLAAEEAAGVVLVEGGIVSHLSILARSLGVPMVIVDAPLLLDIADGTPLLLDAELGNVYVSPSSEILSAFHSRERTRETGRTRGAQVAPTTATADGVSVHLMANINLLTDVGPALSLKAEGVGLYRTEFPFIIRSTFPTEEEQYVVYRRLVESLPDRELTFRTLDVGGDKVLSYYDGFREENPFLGMRSMRFTLEHLDVFTQQIRAILRAGHGADLRIMFPMISSPDEMRRARRLVWQCLRDLEREGQPHNAAPKVGLMVELPSAVMLIDEMAGEADFMSIGTNDLVQYILAVDRTNEKVAGYYLPHHPAVLRAIARTSEAADRAGIGLSVCGEMAQEQQYLPFLLGVGVRTLSVEPVAIPALQTKIGRMKISDARDTAQALLRCGSIAEAEKILGISRARRRR